ncbi:MAG: DNA-directed RNA polymerase subunit omega [Candidatus Pelethousia sp.]|nr:DNA-directed RNA polymerase subunit omega [Candidatus Pelethousia sp.]
MMNKPAVNELQEKVGCRYMLVTTVSKRARQLLDDPDTLGERKPVSAAVDELYNNQLKIEFPEEYHR